MDARLRLPRQPYPGLRPYIDFEAALLFGRERQVREIVERLANTQFVAVLGGSGSGKSSLVIAGVMPELRSYGIPGAGDLWLPMTFTPGTNAGAGNGALAAPRSSPITRLAQRFAAQLKSRGSAEADARRVTEIAEVFRQEAGFARLLDAYGAELDLPTGPEPTEARVLFVLDQFEEVFHPTNRGLADVGLLVERVLDHFFNPHPRCYVVLTMRSEYLNQCAAYLELPDAINKSSYLVRRLDDGELREAITAPAQRFLRLAQRLDTTRRLPREVRFDPAVVERVLRDTRAISHDPDHLPLLQHLLARVWQAALEREELDAAVPSQITEIDLVRAVNAATGGDESPLPDSVNVLRECLNRWPERVYQWHEPPQRAALDALFGRLALRDPNTGQYAQQRLAVDEAAALLGPGRTAADLRALLVEGFLGSVEYLFWDDEDPSRATLKVSHEAFIRGWTRFRELVDRQAGRFEEFAALLRRCADWLDQGRDDDWLLGSGEVRRLLGEEQRNWLADGAERAVAAHLLPLVERDAARLEHALPELDDFVARSMRRQRQRRRVQQALTAATIAMLFFAVVPVALFSVFVQGPTWRRLELLFDGANLANAARTSASDEATSAAESQLEPLLRAAESVNTALTASGGTATMGISRWVIDRFGWVAPVQRQAELLGALGAQSETLVNNRLRSLLGSAVWRSVTPAPRRTEPAPQRLSATCQAPPGATLTGTVYARPPAGGVATGPRRAVFLQQPDADRSLVLYAAAIDANGQCRLGPAILALPDALDARVVFDAGLRHFAYSLLEGALRRPSVLVQEVDWDLDSGAAPVFLRRRGVTMLPDPGSFDRVRALAGAQRAVPVPSWPEPGGSALSVGESTWRFVWPSASLMPAGADTRQFQPLLPAPRDSVCARLADLLPLPPGRRVQGYEVGERHCLVVQRQPLAEEAGGSTSPLAAALPGPAEVGVSLFAAPRAAELDRLAANPPAPIAWLPEFTRLPADAEDGALNWLFGTSGPLRGWLALEVRRVVKAAVLTPTPAPPERIGVPLTTCALWRLGTTLAPQRPESLGGGCDAP